MTGGADGRWVRRPMIFNSLTFLVFFAVVLAMHNTPFSSGIRRRST